VEKTDNLRGLGGGRACAKRKSLGIGKVVQGWKKSSKRGWTLSYTRPCSRLLKSDDGKKNTQNQNQGENQTKITFHCSSSGQASKRGKIVRTRATAPKSPLTNAPGQPSKVCWSKHGGGPRRSSGGPPGDPFKKNGRYMDPPQKMH